MAMFFSFLFYMWAILAVWFELWSLKKSNWESIGSLGKRLDRNTLEKRQGLHGVSSTQKIFLVLMVGYFIWNCVGLFSSQWFLFLTLFGLSLMNGIKALRNSYIWNVWDSVASLVILFTIVINRYHLHIPNIEIFREVKRTLLFW